jgi:predicted DNA-binding protein (MmcQ/YjbR family)
VNAEYFLEFCLSKKGVTDSFPFNETTLSLKVGNKIFALSDIDNFTSVNLKCNQERAIELRETFQGVKPGFHMNKKHWNTVRVDADLSNDLIEELINHSYSLVFDSLKSSVRDGL